MRLNKKKLAAVMMSAVMAASVSPVTAFAAEIAAAAETGTVVAVESVSFDGNGKATVTYNTGYKKILDAIKVTVRDADCTLPELWSWGVTIDGETRVGSETYEGQAALGHNWVKDQDTVVKATCTTPGQIKTYEKCDRDGCGAIKEGSVAIIDTIMAEHTFGGEYKVAYDDKVNVTIDADGKATLIKDYLDGSYTKVTYQECQVCKDPNVRGNKTEEKITVPATNRTLTEVIDSSSLKNIVAGQESALLKQFKATTPDYSKIKLTDCEKEGSFVVKHCDADGNTIYSDTVTIGAHHVYGPATPKFATTEDKTMCTYSYDEKTGELIVVNNSCNNPVTYEEIATCVVNSKHVKKTTKTVAPTGAHVVNTTSKATVEAAVVAAKNLKDGLATDSAEYKAVVALKDIKFTTTATCDAPGVATVTYLCKNCGEDAGTVSFATGKLVHTEGAAVIENKVAATCEKEGSYDVVVNCKYCGKEMSRKTVKVPATGHTYAKDGSGFGIGFDGSVVVDYAGYIQKATYNEFGSIGAYASFSVTPKAYDTCEVCGKTANLETVTEKLQIVSVVKEDGKGNPGTITLNASCTVKTQEGKTKSLTTGDVKFNYFSNMVAYLERNPAKDPLNGLNKDENGVWRYYKDDVFQEEYVGIVEYQGGEFFVANGVLCNKANGLNQNVVDGKWYYLSQGQIQRVDGFAEYDGAWFMLKNGELDLTANGLYGYNGGTFLFAAGKLRTDYSGLWQNPATKEWVFLANGQLQDQYTGTAVYDGQKFELKNGKLVA